MRKVASKVDIG
ncbi:hypothetical protein OXX69_011595, partial [Metschnikowia pulcherrima]